MNPLIHRQFESKAHEKRFRAAMIKNGHNPELVDKTIKDINQKKFFTKPRRKTISQDKVQEGLNKILGR